MTATTAMNQAEPWLELSLVQNGNIKIAYFEQSDVTEVRYEKEGLVFRLNPHGETLVQISQLPNSGLVSNQTRCAESLQQSTPQQIYLINNGNLEQTEFHIEQKQKPLVSHVRAADPETEYCMLLPNNWASQPSTSKFTPTITAVNTMLQGMQGSENSQDTPSGRVRNHSHYHHSYNGRSSEKVKYHPRRPSSIKSKNLYKRKRKTTKAATGGNDNSCMNDLQNERKKRLLNLRYKKKKKKQTEISGFQSILRQLDDDSGILPFDLNTDSDCFCLCQVPASPGGTQVVDSTSSQECKPALASLAVLQKEQIAKKAGPQLLTYSDLSHITRNTVLNQTPAHTGSVLEQRPILNQRSAEFIVLNQEPAHHGGRPNLYQLPTQHGNVSNHGPTQYGSVLNHRPAHYQHVSNHGSEPSGSVLNHRPAHYENVSSQGSEPSGSVLNHRPAHYENVSSQGSEPSASVLSQRPAHYDHVLSQLSAHCGSTLNQGQVQTVQLKNNNIFPGTAADKPGHGRIDACSHASNPIPDVCKIHLANCGKHKDQETAKCCKRTRSTASKERIVRLLRNLLVELVAPDAASSFTCTDIHANRSHSNHHPIPTSSSQSHLVRNGVGQETKLSTTSLSYDEPVDLRIFAAEKTGESQKFLSLCNLDETDVEFLTNCVPACHYYSGRDMLPKRERYTANNIELH